MIEKEEPEKETGELIKMKLKMFKTNTFQKINRLKKKKANNNKNNNNNSNKKKNNIP